MIRESIQYSIHFQKNDINMLRINVQAQIKIHQMIPRIIVQTKNNIE
jgi:hypothetical protein